MDQALHQQDEEVGGLRHSLTVADLEVVKEGIAWPL